MSAEKMATGTTILKCVNGGTLTVRRPRYKKLRQIMQRMEQSTGGSGDLEAVADAVRQMLVGAEGVADEEGVPVEFTLVRSEKLGMVACQEIIDALELADINNVIAMVKPAEVELGNSVPPHDGGTSNNAK